MRDLIGKRWHPFLRYKSSSDIWRIGGRHNGCHFRIASLVQRIQKEKNSKLFVQGKMLSIRYYRINFSS